MNLSLYLPGLLGFSREALHEPPLARALTRILTHASRVPVDGVSYCRQLARLFDCKVAEDGDMPAAAITRLIDDNQRPQGPWLRADPVHLSADAHGVSLLDVGRLQLEQHEALALGAVLQDLFSAHDYLFEVPVAERWYLGLPQGSSIRTREIHEVRGRSILTQMPDGRDAAHWRQLLNEVQMRLNDCDINQQRQAAGKLPVNSVWFWGSGELPDILARRWSRVYADDVLVQGLCMLSGTVCQPVDAFLAGGEAPGERGEDLVILETASRYRDYQHAEAWLDFIEILDRDWFEPIMRLLMANRIERLNILTDTAQFTFHRIHLLRFWRSFGNFADLL